ncbi:MAG: alpha/beta hydrolase [Planctomycetota bacterium]
MDEPAATSRRPRGRRWILGFIAAVPLLALAIRWSECITPPAVANTKTRALPEARQPYPDGTEMTSTQTPAGETLRGLWVPAEPNAPVVLHLLGSGGSCADPLLHLAETARRLRDLGYASLFLDYTGVGNSTGTRSTRNLAGDARAMFDAAVARAGTERRVVIRALSLGTIATASLLRDGARPGALVLLAPVRGRDVAVRFAAEVFGRAASLAAWALLAPVHDAELADALQLGASRPLLVVRPADEPLADADWLAQIEAVTHARGGRFAVRAGDHFRLGVESTELFVPEELAFFTEGIPWGPRRDAATRRELRLDWALGPAAADLPPEPAAQRRVLDDPAGAIPLDLLESSALVGRRIRRLTPFHINLYNASDHVELALPGYANRYRTAVSVTLSNGIGVRQRQDFDALFDRVVERGYAGDDALRVTVRIILKSLGIPDRVRSSPDAPPIVEAWEDGAWQQVLPKPAG